jgi:hypothetical protein
MEMHVDFEQGSYELVSPKTGACWYQNDC